MSRIGRAPITVPAGVEIKIDGSVVTVKGKLGTLTQDIGGDIKCSFEDGTLTVTRDNEHKQTRAKHGLYRALINNMIVGVTNGWEKALIVNGIGFKANVQGNKLVMNIGFSHPVELTAPEGITITCPNVTTSSGAAATEVVVKGIDRNLVGQVAANIRAKRVVEPYHLYGIRYKDEVVVAKEGKTAGK